MRNIVTLSIAILLATPVFAQERTTKSLTSATCTAPDLTGCLTVGTVNRQSLGIQVTGTFVGTVSFEGSVDGTTFVALNAIPPNSTTPATSTTGVGAWQASVGGLSYVRVRFSAYTSGTAVVTTRTAQ